jgi:hypothetical protein
MPLYLAFRGGWLDLARGISGMWALDPKLLFQDPLGSLWLLLEMFSSLLFIDCLLCFCLFWCCGTGE